MPRVCTACAHVDRDALDRAVVRGAPLRQIAAAHGLSESALHRHAAAHLPATLASAEEAREAARGERLLAEIMALQATALDLMECAQGQGDVRAAVVALKEARECVEFRFRIATELGMAEAKTAEPHRIEVHFGRLDREEESDPETRDARPGTLAERLDEREE